MSLASLSESFEPMQVDAEENDNDEVEGAEGAANGPLMVDLTGVGGAAAGLKQVLLDNFLSSSKSFINKNSVE